MPAAPPRPIADFRGKPGVAKYFAQRRDIWPVRVDAQHQREHEVTEEGQGGGGALELDSRILMTTRAWCEASFFDIGAEVGGILATAARLAGRHDGRPRAVVSGFCGVGVDAIAIATSHDIDYVVCVDNDERCIAALLANAAVYGVAGKIRTVVGDIYADETTARVKRVIASLPTSGTNASGGGGGALIIGAHLSPPWGGTGYLYRVATAAGAPPLSNPGPRERRATAHAAAAPYFVSAFDLGAAWGTPNVAVYLPRNVLWAELARQAQRAFGTAAAGADAVSEIGVMEHALRFNGKVKGVTVLTGALVDAASRRGGGGDNDKADADADGGARALKSHRKEKEEHADATTCDLVAPQRPPFAAVARRR